MKTAEVEALFSAVSLGHTNIRVYETNTTPEAQVSPATLKKARTVGGITFAAIAEQPGASGGGRSPLAETRAGWRLFRGSAASRRYLLGRAALRSIEVAAPYYVLAIKAMLWECSGY